MKEIHFHKDMVDLMWVETYSVTHNDTIESIKNGEEIIHTSAISTLDFAWLIDLGYKIVLHENGKSAICCEGSTVLTDKEIRKAHDIRRIWVGGGFNGYFYKNS